MKKCIAWVLTLAMVLSLTACGSTSPAPSEEPQQEEPAAQTEPQEEQAETAEQAQEASTEEVSAVEEAEEITDNAQQFVGIWSCDRATLELCPLPEGGYRCLIHWGGSAFDAAVWEYQCLYGQQRMADQGNGVKSILTWDEDGHEIGNETVYTDGSARFELTAEGGLVWTDDKENAGEGMVFTRENVSAPFPDTLVEQYFHVIGGYEPGVAGSSISMALSASAAVSFASANALWAVDTDELRSNLLAAWEGMSQEEQAHFDANFIDVVTLIDACVEDWDGNAGVFEDGGAAEEMKQLLDDPAALTSWYRLRDFTLTMGNSED